MKRSELREIAAGRDRALYDSFLCGRTLSSLCKEHSLGGTTVAAAVMRLLEVDVLSSSLLLDQPVTILYPALSKNTIAALENKEPSPVIISDLFPMSRLAGRSQWLAHAGCIKILIAISALRLEFTAH